MGRSHEGRSLGKVQPVMGITRMGKLVGDGPQTSAAEPVAEMDSGHLMHGAQFLILPQLALILKMRCCEEGG